MSFLGDALFESFKVFFYFAIILPFDLKMPTLVNLISTVTAIILFKTLSQVSNLIEISFRKRAVRL